MRIGTWNLAGLWTDDHARLIADAECDVWLLTEVNERTVLPGFELHASEMQMAPKRRWAAVASRLPMTPEPDPHAASARVRIGSTTYISSVLPWKGVESASNFRYSAALAWTANEHDACSLQVGRHIQHGRRFVHSSCDGFSGAIRVVAGGRCVWTTSI